MYKIKAEITTDNGVLEAGKVLDVKKYLKPKEIKELESAGYIEVCQTTKTTARSSTKR